MPVGCKLYLGLNPTYAGKRISDKVLRMRDARNTFTFPCGVSRRCPPTVTAHSANGCSSLDDHLEAVHPFIRLSPNRRRALVSSVASDRVAGRAYSLSAYQVNMGVLIPFCWMFLLCLGLGRCQEISSSISTQTKGCTLNLKCGTIFSVRI